MKLTKHQQEVHDWIVRDIQLAFDGELIAEKLLVMVGPAGCSMAGSLINVQCKPNYISKEEFINELKINEKIFTTLMESDKIFINDNLYDINNINLNIIELLKEYPYSRKTLLKDKEYTSKYLKLEYWISFNDYKYSIDKVRYLRKYEKYFEPSIFENITYFNPDNKAKTILSIQKQLLDDDISFKHPNLSLIVKDTWIFYGYNEAKAKELAKLNQNGRQCTTIEFWLNKGYNESEAKDKVSEIQSKNSLKFQKKRKENPENYKDISSNQIGYWTKKGYTEEEAKEKVSKRQSTFSKKKCIEKYGSEEGLKVWQDRQDKWQNSLWDKPQEEIDKINKSKNSAFKWAMNYFNLNEYELTEKLNAIDIDKLTKYNRKVIKLTDEVYLEHIDTIDPNRLRGNKGDISYHLDHKFSRTMGYLLNVPVEIMASKWNLEILTHNENISKSYECSIELEELERLYHENRCK